MSFHTGTAPGGDWGQLLTFDLFPPVSCAASDGVETTNTMTPITGKSTTSATAIQTAAPNRIFCDWSGRKRTPESVMQIPKVNTNSPARENWRSFDVSCINFLIVSRLGLPSKRSPRANFRSGEVTAGDLVRLPLVNPPKLTHRPSRLLLLT